jgi:hypothetical protein
VRTINRDAMNRLQELIESVPFGAGIMRLTLAIAILVGIVGSLVTGPEFFFGELGGFLLTSVYLCGTWLIVRTIGTKNEGKINLQLFTAVFIAIALKVPLIGLLIRSSRFSKPALVGFFVGFGLVYLAVVAWATAWQFKQDDRSYERPQ